MFAKITVSCLLFLFLTPASAAHAQETFTDISQSINHLKKISAENPPELNTERIAPLIRLALDESRREEELPKLNGMSGAFYRFDVPATVSDIIRYGYNPEMPSYVLRPSCVRYSNWKETYADQSNTDFSTLWEKADNPPSNPLIIQGLEYEEITPDHSSGAYYGYDQLRTLALFESQNATVFLSICLQDQKSSVGQKGEILGNDTGWNYFYSGEKGITKTGLGWADSYIYSAFTITLYIQKPGETESICICLNWLDAGWMGMNFVKSKHITDGLKRFARDLHTIFSSQKLPAAEKITALQKKLADCPEKKITKIYQEILSNLCAEFKGNLLQEYCPQINNSEFAKKVPRKYMENRIGLLRLKKWLGRDKSSPDISESICQESSANNTFQGQN